MTKNKYSVYTALILILASVLTVGCSQDESEPAWTSGKSISVPMKMNASAPTFDGTATRSGYSWAEGSRIYFKFDAEGGGFAYGTGVYSAGNWTLTCREGSLVTGRDTHCQVWFFEGATATDVNVATLAPTTCTYVDTAAKYLFLSNEITVDASLKPEKVRLRFQGTSGTTLTLRGWEHNSTFTGADWTYTTSSADLSLTVGADGYTPYIYGGFANTKTYELEAEVGGTPYFRTFSATTLTAGKSHALNLPTAENISETKWHQQRIYSLGDAPLKLVRVDGGTFQMGSNDVAANDNRRPAHNVTLSTYYIGETEVTQALWEAVMGSNPSTYQSANNPVDNVSWDDCQTFITALNERTGLRFRLPTEAEWEFAARGGNKSQGYTYAGSNDISEVSWYVWSDIESSQPVASLKANELGLYDMSGNLVEWVADWMGSYGSSDVTNPTGPASGTEHVLRGGDWTHASSFHEVTFRTSSYPNSRNFIYGFRLCLK